MRFKTSRLLTEPSRDSNLELEIPLLACAEGTSILFFRARVRKLPTPYNDMMSRLRLLLPLSFCFTLARLCKSAETNEPSYSNIDGPPHHYRAGTPQDRFTRAMGTIENDQRLDRSSEKAFLLSFLKILGVPPSSQMLVFSTTSMQLQFISASNPRAIYFCEDIYVGYIPGARIEVAALDPELGAIFYIFDIPRPQSPIRFERSQRCMHCHSGEDTGYVPGLVIKSVAPGPGGGSLDSFRRLQSGHGVPFGDRFGGWYVTGKHGITNHWGNLIGRYVDGEITREPNPPGSKYQWAKYPVATSDILAHLLLEHQVGFVNRVVEAGYRARSALFASNGKLTPAQELELDEQAKIVTRYLLFADEVPLPAGGVEPDMAYKADFLQDRRQTIDGFSLKDLDLETRLFKHRCSYMIYTAIFQELPPALKNRIYRRLKAALSEKSADKEFEYLPRAERRTIRGILKATLPDLRSNW